jgi:hypothetical protein
MEGATKARHKFWRLVMTSFGDFVSGRHGAPYTIISGIISVVAIMLAISLDGVPLIWRMILVVVPFVSFMLVASGYSFYNVWKVQYKKALSLEKSNSELLDRLSPKIELLIDGNGVSEDMDAKRVQLVVRGKTKAPLINCEAFLEQLSRLGEFPHSMMEEPLRCEWSNSTGNEKFRRAIPDGVAQRVNLFVITRSGGRRLFPLVEFPSEQLSMGINMGGRFKVSMAIAADNAATFKEMFLFEWKDFDQITLRPWTECASSAH